MTPLVAQFGGAAVVLELRRAAVDALRARRPEGQPAGRAREPRRRPEHGVGQLPDALVTLDELERTLAGGGAPELRIALHQNRGVVLRGLGDASTRRSRDLERAEAVAREAGRPGRRPGRGRRARRRAGQLGRTQEALAATAIQVEAATASGEAPARMRALLTRAPLLAQATDIAGAAKCVAEGEYLARDLGDLEWLATALTLHVQLRSGRTGSTWRTTRWRS